MSLLEKDEVKAKRPSMWNIVFYNDDYTPMDFVEFVLKVIFHMSTLDALALTIWDDACPITRSRSEDLLPPSPQPLLISREGQLVTRDRRCPVDQ
jgi:ATP-dependent Clp protease adaptor protein ClpS